jgi:hypothetical protein
MTFAPWSTLSLLTQHERIYFLDLAQFKDWSPPMQLKPRKKFITTNTSLIFLFLAIEIFGCLHKHVDVFLHDCANGIWSLKRRKGFHLYTLVNFFHRKISITL